jgi:spore germination protein
VTNSITNRQMVFILFMTLTTVTLMTIPKIMAESAGVGSWVTLMSAAVIFGVLAVVIVSLNNMFQGKVLFDYCQKLIGKVGSYIIAVFYILYFLAITTDLSSSLSNMLKSNILLKTPQWATLFASLFICGYAAYKGITNIARIFEIYGFIFLFAVVTVHITMLFQGNPENILPLYVPSETGKYFAAMKDAIFPFLGIEVLTVIPFTVKNGKKASKIAFLTLIGVGLIYVLATESSIMMIGRNEIVHYQDAMIAAIRQVELPKIEFLKRVDVLHFVVDLMAIHAGIMIAYTSAVEYVCRVFSKVSRVIAVICVGSAIFILGLVALGINNFDKAFGEIIIYFGLVAAAFIPILLFVIAKVKKHAGKVS